MYKHTSPSGKCYVGITSQAPECRWGNDGCKYLEIHKNGKLKHPYFAQAILKYGWDNIKHELLHEKLSKEEACKLEQKYIAEYKSQSLSYNITDGGERTKALYEATMDSFAAMGDMEMTAVYNAYSKEVTD